MNLPKKVKILYKEYTVEQQENLHDEEGELYGQIHYMPEKILLNTDSSDEQKKAVLLHEVIHGMDEMYCIGLKEKQVEKLGNGFWNVHSGIADIRFYVYQIMF